MAGPVSVAPGPLSRRSIGSAFELIAGSNATCVAELNQPIDEIGMMNGVERTRLRSPAPPGPASELPSGSGGRGHVERFRDFDAIAAQALGAIERPVRSSEQCRQAGRFGI